MAIDKPTKAPRSSFLTRLLTFAASLCVLAAVVLYLVTAEDTIDVKTETSAANAALPVSVELVKATKHDIRIEAYASVVPRWRADIVAAVSGRVMEVSEKALAGKRVKENTILARIEPSRYEAELSASRSAVKEAELILWQARNAHLLAEKQFRRNGQKPPNILALKLPQLDIAKAKLNQAQAQAKAAEQQVSDTVIVAPFSGFVTDRSISPGQSVNVGDKLLHLVDDHVFELVIQIGPKDWPLLAHPLKGQRAAILNSSGEIVASAKIREAAGFLDNQTRQHKVYLTVDAKENTEILAGDFLKVSLPGKAISHALSIPESARTQEGHVWFVDDQSRLQRTSPEVIFRKNGRVIVRYPNLPDSTNLPDSADLKVVIIPLASFLPGQAVQLREDRIVEPAHKEAN